MKIDLKLVFLVLVVLCLVAEIHGWGRSRSRSGSRSRSVSRSSYRRSGYVRRSYRRSRYRRSSSRVRHIRRSRYRRSRVRHIRRSRYRRSRVRHIRRSRYRRYRRYRKIRRFRKYRRYRKIRRFRKYRRYRKLRRFPKYRRYRKLIGKPKRKRKGWFSKSGRKIKARPPHSIKTKSGLTRLYNSKVVKVERYKRPLKGFLGKFGIKHSGVVVTTASGKRWLVHKGKGYGYKGGQTIVTEAKNMGKGWKLEKWKDVKGAKVGDYVKTGGKKYRVLTDNCHHASHQY